MVRNTYPRASILIPSSAPTYIGCYFLTNLRTESYIPSPRAITVTFLSIYIHRVLLCKDPQDSPIYPAQGLSNSLFSESTYTGCYFLTNLRTESYIPSSRAITVTFLRIYIHRVLLCKDPQDRFLYSQLKGYQTHFPQNLHTQGVTL